LNEAAYPRIASNLAPEQRPRTHNSIVHSTAEPIAATLLNILNSSDFFAQFASGSAPRPNAYSNKIVVASQAEIAILQNLKRAFRHVAAVNLRQRLPVCRGKVAAKFIFN